MYFGNTQKKIELTYFKNISDHSVFLKINIQHNYIIIHNK